MKPMEIQGLILDPMNVFAISLHVWLRQEERQQAWALTEDRTWQVKAYIVKKASRPCPKISPKIRSHPAGSSGAFLHYRARYKTAGFAHVTKRDPQLLPKVSGLIACFRPIWLPIRSTSSNCVTDAHGQYSQLTWLLMLVRPCSDIEPYCRDNIPGLGIGLEPAMHKAKPSLKLDRQY